MVNLKKVETTCPRCKGTLRDRAATEKRPYRYSISGLENVFLIGINVRSCSNCGLEAPTIPKAGQLNRMLLNGILSQAAKLQGFQLSYIRKSVGMSARKFSSLLGITPESLSRIENGKQAQSQSVDRLARAIVAVAIDSASVREVILEHAEEAGGRLANPRFGFRNDRWQAAS